MLKMPPNPPPQGKPSLPLGLLLCYTNMILSYSYIIQGAVLQAHHRALFVPIWIELPIELPIAYWLLLFPCGRTAPVIMLGCIVCICLGNGCLHACGLGCMSEELRSWLLVREQGALPSAQALVAPQGDNKANMAITSPSGPTWGH